MSSAIELEITKLPFPPEVKAKACEVYRMIDLKAVPRDVNRSRVKCYCVFQAYNELEYVFVPDPGHIGKELGLALADSNLAIRKRPRFRAGFVPKSVTRTPQSMLQSYLDNHMKLPEDISGDMVSTFNRVLTSNTRLLLERPKPLIAAYITAYAANSGLSVDMNHLTSLLYIRTESVRPIRDMLQECVMAYM